jgi:hypothetical protein
MVGDHMRRRIPEHEGKQRAGHMAVIYVRFKVGPLDRNRNIKKVDAGNADEPIIPSSA